jgi:hypothetical protein
MKKIFAIILMGVIIMHFSLTACAEDNFTRWDIPEDSSDDTETEEVEDGKLTLELLEQIESWEELCNKVLPISDVDRANIDNKEDQCCVALIESINVRNKSHVYHDQEYISVGLVGIPMKGMNYNRLIQKYNEIIRIYNESNDLYLVWESKPLSGNCFQINVESTNSIDMRNPATKVGQKVILKPGIKYWESAENDGSGKYDTVTKNNTHIPRGGVVTVNGYAYYTDDSRNTIEELYYRSYSEIGDKEAHIIEPWRFRMLHICTPTTDLGWVYPEDVIIARTCK